jgi:hypothetical protein
MGKSAHALLAAVDTACANVDELGEPARQHYRQRRERGDRHAAATRNLFNKLLGQLYYCLQHHQTFDEAKAFPMPLCEAA